VADPRSSIDALIVPLAVFISLGVTLRRLRHLQNAGYRREDLVQALGATMSRVLGFNHPIAAWGSRSLSPFWQARCTWRSWP
jgi:hypothetical protein